MRMTGLEPVRKTPETPEFTAFLKTVLTRFDKIDKAIIIFRFNYFSFPQQPMSHFDILANNFLPCYNALASHNRHNSYPFGKSTHANWVLFSCIKIRGISAPYFYFPYALSHASKTCSISLRFW